MFFFFFFHLGFKGAGRGLIASDDLFIGDAALEIPESLIISEDLIFQSEMVCSTTINFFSLKALHFPLKVAPSCAQPFLCIYNLVMQPNPHPSPISFGTSYSS